MKDISQTMEFNLEKEKKLKVEDIIVKVYKALEEKGYDSTSQMVGYILSGDPTYITSYNDARTILRELERDEILEELLTKYLENK